MKQRISIFLLAIAIFLLPLGTRLIIAPGNLNNGWWEYGTVSIYVSEVFILAAALLSFLRRQESIPGNSAGRSIVSRMGTCLRRCDRPRQIAIPISVFVIVVLLIRGHNFGWLLHVITGGVFVSLLYQYRERSEVFIKVFIASAVGQSMLGIIQVTLQKVWGTKWLGTALQLPQIPGASVVMHHGERFLRAYGTLPHPNIFGAYVVCGFFFALLILQKEAAKKYWYIAATLITALGVLFSFSRAAYISLFLALAIVFWKYRKEKIIQHTAVRVIAIVAIFASIFYGTISNRLTASGPLETRSVDERVSSTKEAWELIKRHPVIGVGGGAYTKAVHEELDNTRPSFSYHPVHNVPLLLLVEVGILGVLLMVALCWGIRISQAILILIPFFLFDHFLWSLWPGLGLLGFMLSEHKFRYKNSLDI